MIPFIIVPKPNILQSDGIRHLTALSQKAFLFKIYQGLWGSWTETIECFTEDQAFSLSFYLAHSPPFPLLSPVSKLIWRTWEDWERETTCWREGQGHIIRQRESLVLSSINHSILSGLGASYSRPKKIYIERRPSFFAFAGIGTKMKKRRGIRR